MGILIGRELLKKQKREMNNKTFIIAELSANHNHNYDLAVKTIEAMAESGADAVKIQTYTPDSLVMNIDNEYFGAIKSGIWKGIKKYDLYKEACTPYEWQPKLKDVAENLGLVFFSTPFDLDGVDFLAEMNIPIYKIASFEINDIPLIRKVAQQHKPIIMSTGVAGIDDIDLAINTCHKEGCYDITLLKCTSEYPASYDDANLLTIPDMSQRFGVKVGVSDHSMGSIVPITSVALGAEAIEKHFILDRSLGGPDSAFSMEPAEFKKMVEEVRIVERTLGHVDYELTERKRLQRRSLFAYEEIQEGDAFTDRNVRSLRPGHGVSPKYYDAMMGKLSKRHIEKGTPIYRNDFE